MSNWFNRSLITLLLLAIIAFGLLLGRGLAPRRSPAEGPRRDGRRNEFSSGAMRSDDSDFHPALNAVSGSPKPPSPPDDYIGSSVCTECHADVAREYQGHPMSRSLARTNAASPLEDYDERNVFESPRGLRFRVERRDDRVFHREQLIDAQGQPVYDDVVEIHYALGSGTRGRSYLIGQHDILRLSPIGWYSQAGWDLSPGYKPGMNQRFDRRVTDGCLQCHAGRVHFDRESPNRFPDPPFYEESIGCERCHGPGAEHVAFRRHRDTEGQDPIVNPDRLRPEEREAVCNQCHLQAEERIPRYGRSDHDFRPGQRISDIWSVFMRAPQTRADGSIPAVTQVEQMRSSRCYQMSQGRMGCTSCHDPHRVSAQADRSQDYQVRCLSCHTEQSCTEPIEVHTKSNSSGSCIACHMPALAMDVVPHASQTDHRILRSYSASQSSRTVSNELRRFDDGGIIPLGEQLRARGLLLIRQAEPRQSTLLAAEAQDALTKCRSDFGDDVEVLEAIGVCELIQQRPQNALEIWSQALAMSSQRESLNWRLGTLYHDLGQFDKASHHLQRVIQQNPGLAVAHARLAHIYGRMGQMDLGIKSAERALQLDPTLSPVLVWLGEAYSRQGNESARHQIQTVQIRLRESLERVRADREQRPDRK